jgi:hypothetical protein
MIKPLNPINSMAGQTINHFTPHEIEITDGSPIIKITVAGWHSVEDVSLKPIFKQNLTIYYPTWTIDAFETLASVVNNHPEWLGQEAPAGSVWNPLTSTWVVYPVIPLEDIQQVKWNEIKAIRDTKEFDSFTYNGMVFDGDVNAQRRLAGYISVSKSALQNELPFSADFILADNSEVTLTAEDFIGIEMAKVIQVAGVFAVATNLRNQIYAATSKEEVEALIWPQ